MYIYTYICSTNNEKLTMKTTDQYFDNKIAKLQHLLGLAIGTPAIVIIITEILMQTL